MRFIPTRVHGMLDYLVGALLIAAPWIFGFSDNEAATWVPVIIGASTIVYSLLTNYELGAVPLISMPTHLGIDGLAGIVLLVSPWLFGFETVVWAPHVMVGIVEVMAALTTHRIPAAQSAPHRS